MILFILSETASFGRQVAHDLGVGLSRHEERGFEDFEDGERKARPLVCVRSRDAYVVQSLHAGPQASANDKLCKLLFFLSTLRENGAARITALVPYLAYARKDRQFARMKAGTRVVFKEEPGEQGPQASTVTLMGKHGLK